MNKPKGLAVSLCFEQMLRYYEYGLLLDEFILVQSAFGFLDQKCQSGQRSKPQIRIQETCPLYVPFNSAKALCTLGSKSSISPFTLLFQEDFVVTEQVTIIVHFQVVQTAIPSTIASEDLIPA